VAAARGPRRSRWPRNLFLGLGLVLLMSGPARGAPVELGSALPPLRGDLLDGRKIVLPDSAQGSVLLLLLGFTYESRHDVEAWAERFRHEFGSNSGVRCYEVPVIGGLGRVARPFINRGMRRGTPRELHDRVITMYGGAKEWKRHVGFLEPDVAYLLLVDRTGRVVWRAQGPFGDEGYLALTERARGLRP
jgi:hypothetical protein